MSIPTGKYYLLLAVATLVVIIDQASKYIIVTHVGLYESITVIPGFFNIVHVQNPGAAFGLFSQQAPMIRNIVLVVDFLDLYIGSFHWPAFNVADSAISVGMVVFAYYVIFRKVPI